MKKTLLILFVSSLFLVGCKKTPLNNNFEETTIQLNVKNGQSYTTIDPNRLFGDKEQLIKSIRVITFDIKNGKEFIDANTKELFNNTSGSQNISVAVRKYPSKDIYVIVNETPDMTPILDDVRYSAQLERIEYQIADYFTAVNNAAYRHKNANTTANEAPFSALPMSATISNVNVITNTDAINVGVGRNLARVDVSLRKTNGFTTETKVTSQTEFEYNTTSKGKIYGTAPTSSIMQTLTKTGGETISIPNFTGKFKQVLTFYTPARKSLKAEDKLSIKIKKVEILGQAVYFDPIVVREINEIKANNLYKIDATIKNRTEIVFDVTVDEFINEEVTLPDPPAPNTYRPANCIVTKPGATIVLYPNIAGRVLSNKSYKAFNPNLPDQASYGINSPRNDGYTYVMTPTKPVSVAVKWQTAHGRVDGANASQMLIPSTGITYNATTGKCEIKINASSIATPGGSAYVCAYTGPLDANKNGTGTILWSWHIWVVGESKPILTNVTTALGDMMMDRAIGAIDKVAGVNAFGMMYQWGRKDPFTPSITTNTEVQIYNATGTAIPKSTSGIGTADGQFKFDNTTTTTINHLIQNPSTHYDKEDITTPIASTGDLTNDWWNPETKTLYDPCPNGYRIPKLGTYGEGGQVETHLDWSVWSAGELQEGRIFKNLSFFPANGLRSYSAGTFYGLGTFGYSWMSTPYSPTYGHNLYVSSGYVNPNNTIGRSHGTPVRCIIE